MQIIKTASLSSLGDSRLSMSSNEQVNAVGSDEATQEDLEALYQIQDNLDAQLASLRNRVDASETQTAELEANQDFKDNLASLRAQLNTLERLTLDSSTNRSKDNSLSIPTNEQVSAVGDFGNDSRADNVLRQNQVTGANALNPDVVRQEDLATLKRLQEAFAEELSFLRGREGAIETQTSELKAGQTKNNQKLANLQGRVDTLKDLLLDGSTDPSSNNTLSMLTNEPANEVGDFGNNNRANNISYRAQVGANALTTNEVTREDLAVLQQRQEDLGAQLGILRGRVDALEAATAELEANQESGDVYEIATVNGRVYALEVLLLGVSDGANGNDTFTGSDGNDTLYGGAGKDELSGRGGNDELYGGTGEDILNGGDGRDFAYYSDAKGAVTVNLATGVSDGANGKDTLISIEGVIGSAFNDTLYASSSSDFSSFLSGGASNDQLFARDGFNVFYGDSGNDTLTGGGGTNIFYGGAGNDQLSGGNGFNIFYGDSGNDQLSGREGDDQLDGGAGNDQLNGGAGNDQLNGGAGNDQLNGESGVDTADYSQASGAVNVNLAKGRATGADGKDTLINIEEVIGGIGADTLVGGIGFDQLDGGAGNDTLSGGAGNDTLSGGAGADLLKGGEGDDFLEARSSFFIFIEDSNNILIGGAGNDGLIGEDGNDTLDGGTGNDGLSGGAGADLLKGGEGDDFLRAGNSNSFTKDTSNNILIGGAGNDGLIGEDGNDTLDGGTGSDTLSSGAGADLLKGGEGNDFLEAGRSIFGFIEDTGNNILIGGAGNDQLLGGSGADILTGGAGSDKFLYDTNRAFVTADVGVDTLTDFVRGSDKFVLDQTTFTVLNDGFSFQRVTSDAAADNSSADIVYSSANGITTGKLFYNTNGTADGFGSGAQFAVLTNLASPLTASDFLVVD